MFLCMTAVFAYSASATQPSASAAAPAATFEEWKNRREKWERNRYVFETRNDEGVVCVEVKMCLFSCVKEEKWKNCDRRRGGGDGDNDLS